MKFYIELNKVDTYFWASCVSRSCSHRNSNGKLIIICCSQKPSAAKEGSGMFSIAFGELLLVSLTGCLSIVTVKNTALIFHLLVCFSPSYLSSCMFDDILSVFLSVFMFVKLGYIMLHSLSTNLLYYLVYS